MNSQGTASLTLAPAGESPRKRSLGRNLEEALSRSSPFSLFSTALILGMVVLFCSVFVDIHYIAITHNSIRKEVGLFSAPNWTVVYLVLFPLFLVLLSRQASYVRAMLREAAVSGCVVSTEGERISEQSLIDAMTDAFSAATRPLVLLAFATAIVSLGGWYTSCYVPLHHWSTGSQVVGWGTAPIEFPERRPDQLGLILYTLVAYCWMGVALYVYIACLFANLIYAVFFHKLANGDVSVGDMTLRLVSRAKLPGYLSEYLYNLLVACLLGFVAAFLMQLETQFLLSDETNILSFWFSDVKGLGHLAGYLKSAIFGGIALPEGHFQDPAATDQTGFTSLAVLAATLVVVAAGVWLIQATLRAARAYTASIATNRALLDKIGLTLATADIARLEQGDELSQVFPTIKTSATLCTGVIFCTIFPRFGLLFSSIIVVATYRYLSTRLSRLR